MALPRISIEVEADVVQALGGLDAVEDKLRRMSAQARRTGRQVGRSSAFGRGIQNASFQLGDFAVQVGAGTAASIALGQQLPQLLGGFGVLGAVLGAVVAVAVPLTRVFRDLAKDSEELSGAFGTMQPLISAIGDAFRFVRDTGVEMAELIINNLDRIIAIGLTAAAVFGGKFVAGFIAARIATFNLAGALFFLRGALIRTGIGVLIVGAGELVYRFSKLAEVAGGFGKALGLLYDVAKEVFQRIAVAANAIPVSFERGALAMKRFFLGALADMLQAFQDFTWDIAEGFNSLFNTNLQGASFDAISGMGTGWLDRAISDTMLGEADAATRMDALREQLNAPLESIQAIKDLLASFKDENLDLPSLLAGASEDGDGKGKKGKSAWEQMIENMEMVQKKGEMLRSSQQGVWGAMGDFIQQFAGKSKLAAIAAIAIQKGLSISQIIANSAAAQLRALAELGPIAGPPMAAKIAMYGRVQAALVAATGLAQAASAGGGGAGGVPTVGGAGAGGGQTVASSEPAQPRVSRSLTLIGESFSRSQMIRQAEFMNEGTDDGLVIRGRR